MLCISDQMMALTIHVTIEAGTCILGSLTPCLSPLGPEAAAAAPAQCTGSRGGSAVAGRLCGAGCWQLWPQQWPFRSAGYCLH